MPKTAAGILLYRQREALEILLLHHGGPYWAKKDAGAWTFPKGLVEPDEAPAAAARREFAEETGTALPIGTPLLDLGEAKMKSGKLNRIFAAEGDFDPATLRSNTVRLQWPPRSGRYQDFLEVDRAIWADVESARLKLNAALVVFVERLLVQLDGS